MKLFELYADLSLNSKKFTEGINQASQAGKTFQGHLQSISAKTIAMGNALYDVGKQAVKSVGNLTKSIIEEYSDTEQLIGGVQTLFKESANDVIANANRAYKTAGLSANEYMQNVTSFASTLMQSLKGNTMEAAQYADMAVQDMSDNANKFGTNIGMIQNAYQGFAKQNYTMLDNLKLGYGGTQKEMQRLLRDAAKIQRANGINVRYNINNMDDIIEAIHVIQNEMGITGTTAAEASETISGSFNSFKASWKNVLSGIAQNDADIDHLFGTLFDSGKNLFENIFEIVPAIGRNATKAFDIIVDEANEALPMLKNIFVDAWDKKLPNVVRSGANGIISIINDLFGTNIPAIKEISFPTWAEVETAFNTWWTSTKSNIETGASWVLGIFNEPTATAEEIKATVSGWWIDTAIPALQDTCKWYLQLPEPPQTDGNNESTVSAIMSTWWTPFGEAISNFCSWSLQMFNLPSETADDVGAYVKTWWDSVNVGLGDITTIAISLVAGDYDSALSTLQNFWNHVKEAFGDAATIHYDIMAPAVDPVVNAISSWWNNQVVPALNLTLPVPTGSGVHITKSGRPTGGGGFNWNAPLEVIPGHANGLDYVPHDDYLARLHEGEAVLTSREADEWRRGNFESSAPDFTQVEHLLSQILFAVQNPSPVPAVIDGDSVYSYVARRQYRAIHTERYAK